MTLEQFDAIWMVGAAIAAVIVIFLLAREVTLWYFRINERTKLLKDILTELKKQNEEVE